MKKRIYPKIKSECSFTHKTKISCLDFKAKAIENNPLSDSWYDAAMNNPLGDIPNNNPCERDEIQQNRINALFSQDFYKFMEEND